MNERERERDPTRATANPPLLLPPLANLSLPPLTDPPLPLPLLTYLSLPPLYSLPSLPLIVLSFSLFPYDPPRPNLELHIIDLQPTAHPRRRHSQRSRYPLWIYFFSVSFLVTDNIFSWGWWIDGWDGFFQVMWWVCYGFQRWLRWVFSDCMMGLF